MKKINIILIIIISICGIISTLKQPIENIAVFLKNISIILTVSLPYLYQKIFKAKLPEFFITIWIVFICMAHYLGVILEWYNVFPGFDKITHTISGFLTGYVAIMIIKTQKVSSKAFKFLFIIAFSSMCAFMWEIFEFVCNILFGGDAQRVAETGVDDTMLDMIVAFVGSIIVAIIYTYLQKNKKR